MTSIRLNNVDISPDKLKAAMRDESQEAKTRSPPTAEIQKQATQEIPEKPVQEIRQIPEPTIEQIDVPHIPQSQPQSSTQGKKNMITEKKVGLSSYNAGNFQLSAGAVQDTYLNKVSEVLDTLLKNSSLQGYNVVMRPVPSRSDSTQNVSYILIECRDSDKNPTAVGYTAIVLASSYAQELPTQRFTIRQQNGFVDSSTEIRLADSDVCDQHLLRLMSARVQRCNPGIPENRFFIAEPTVLPRSFVYTDADQIRRILINAINAASLNLNKSLGAESEFVDFTLANVSARGTEDVEVVYTDDTTVDEVGLPRRADLRVIIATAQSNNNDRSRVAINGDNAAQTLAEVSAFVDLTWNCTATAQNSLLGGLIPNQANSVPKLYTPRVVLTRIRTDSIRSLPMQLLALATSVATLSMDNDRRIREYFVGATKSSTNPYRDLAGVGFDLFPLVSNNNQSGPLPTKGEQATPGQLMDLLSMIFHQATYAIDVPEYSSDSWTLSPFLSAAAGKTEAIKEIIGAANFLTGGKFDELVKQYLNGKYPTIVLNDNNRIHAGFYQDGQTARYVDLRSVDYLMVQNSYGADQRSEVDAWSQSFTEVNASLEQRVAKRWEQINNITAGSAVQTGWHRRLGLGGEFLNILVQSVAACDYSPNIRDNRQYGVNDVRTAANFLNAGAIGSLNNSQFFNQTPQAGGNRVGMGGMFTRFDNFGG